MFLIGTYIRQHTDTGLVSDLMCACMTAILEVKTLRLSVRIDACKDSKNFTLIPVKHARGQHVRAAQRRHELQHTEVELNLRLHTSNRHDHIEPNPGCQSQCITTAQQHAHDNSIYSYT